MSFYSSLYIGDYFIFIPSASIHNPVSLKFRDKTNKLKNVKNKRNLRVWRKKIYLYPDILQRKWIEYSYKDKFIPSVSYDNVSPFKLKIPLYLNIGKKFKIELKSTDYSYKNLQFLIKNLKSEVVFTKDIQIIKPGKEYVFEALIKTPGIYRIFFKYEDRDYYMKSFLIYRNLFNIRDNSNLIEFVGTKKIESLYLFCGRCLGSFGFFKSILKDKFLYKDYIPFNDLLDVKSYDNDYIRNFIKSLPNPPEYTQGLMHLLNMIRLSSAENEIKIMGNLFKDDPAFAYFITNRLFLFDMIPLIDNAELQNILRFIDDFKLAQALFNEKIEIIKKIFDNISDRRVKFVKKLMENYKYDIQRQRLPIIKTSKIASVQKEDFLKKETDASTKEMNINAKDEINKTIKNYFLKKYGRIIKIPISKIFIFDKINPINTIEFLKLIENTFFSKNTDEFIHLHSGDLIIFDGTDIALIDKVKSKSFDECLPFNFEQYGNKIFEIVSIDESTIYLESLIMIKLAVIHVYDWKNNLENIEKLEQIKKSNIIPIFYPSEICIMTIGALDFRDRPHEQIIRIRIDN